MFPFSVLLIVQFNHFHILLPYYSPPAFFTLQSNIHRIVFIIIQNQLTFTKGICRERENRTMAKEGWLYSPESCSPAATQQRCMPDCAQQWVPWSYRFGKSWLQEATLCCKLQIAWTIFCGVPLDNFRCYQPCYIVSHVLLSTGSIVHLNCDQVLEQLRLFPSKGESRRLKDSCFKILGREKGWVSDSTNPSKKPTYFLMRRYSHHGGVKTFNLPSQVITEGLWRKAKDVGGQKQP